MIEINTFDELNKPSDEEKKQILNFLFSNLEEYGDPKSSISKCMDYALKESNSFGGHISVAKSTGQIVGAVIVNRTGMDEYIPNNILVYIATDKNKRGQGIGKKLMQETIEQTNGSIALHVEPHNPAKKLYESFGFTNKYLEMRLQK